MARACNQVGPIGQKMGKYMQGDYLTLTFERWLCAQTWPLTQRHSSAHLSNSTTTASIRDPQKKPRDGASVRCRPQAKRLSLIHDLTLVLALAALVLSHKLPIHVFFHVIRLATRVDGALVEGHTSR
ncbi:hypothetical protein BDV93DRAFT_584727 [Ceratobasidium sp. AG-I]|nr:hypothetical protein BDV93DRAFT_584727 [Ceratobasidium sp. AG-I]